MIRSILVATDGSGHAKKAVALAGDLGARYGAKVVLVHVLLANAPSETLRQVAAVGRLPKRLRNLLDNYEVDARMEMAVAGMDGGFVTVPAPRELLQAIGQQIVDRANKVLERAGVKKVLPVLTEGDPAEAILAQAVKHKAGMIVIGSRGLSDFKGLVLGSVSHKVSARADCTCVSVK